MDYPLRLVGQLRAHLQALRKQRGLTQAQLGQRLGLSQVRIAEIEANPGVVSIEQLARILSALGATLVLRDLIAESPTRPEAEPPPKPEPTRRARRVMPTSTPKKGSW